MSFIGMWREILDASGLSDEASEIYGHDILDGIKKDAYGEDLGKTFVSRCSAEQVRGWQDVEKILKDFRRIEGFENLRLPMEAVDSMIDQVYEDQGLTRVKGLPHLTSVRRGTYSDEWGTPEHILAWIKKHFGQIDIDLASNEKANEKVQAKRYYACGNACPMHVDVTPGEIVFCNPPGPLSSVKVFWEIWLSCIERGARGAFLIFNIDHWRSLEILGQRPVIILRKRLRFDGAPSGASFASALVLSDGDCPLGQRVLWGS